MTISNNSDYGIDGATVNGFSLKGSTISNNGNATGEAGMAFTGLTRDGHVRHGHSGRADTVTGNVEDGLRVANTSGSLDMTVTKGSFSNQNAAGVASDGIQVAGGNAANRDPHHRRHDLRLEPRRPRPGDDHRRQPPSGHHDQEHHHGDPPGPHRLCRRRHIGLSQRRCHGGVAVQTNTITNFVSSAVNHNFVNGTGTLDTRVTGNTLNRDATDSTAGGDGIRLIQNGATTVKALIMDNTTGGHNFAGIELQEGDGNGSDERPGHPQHGDRGRRQPLCGHLREHGHDREPIIPRRRRRLRPRHRRLDTLALKNSITRERETPRPAAPTSASEERFATTVRLPGYTGRRARPAAGNGRRRLLHRAQRRQRPADVLHELVRHQRLLQHQSRRLRLLPARP